MKGDRLGARRGLSLAGSLLLAGLAFVFILRFETDGPKVRETSPAHEAEAARRRRARDSETGPIRIGWTAWADAEIVSHLTARILEERLGVPTELVMADIGIQYQGVANGELDVMLMAWLPITHADYWTAVAGRVINLGPIYTRARLGWAVPAHVPETSLTSLEDLDRPEVRKRLLGRIHGIDPGSGLMRASDRALEIYGLDGYELVAASGAAMTAALGRAVARGDWIVVTAWNPHWMFAEWDLRYLRDPEGALGGWERVHVLTRAGFDQDHPPEVTELLTRMFIPLDELEAALLTATSSSVEAAVDVYLAEHPDRVRYWLTGEVDDGGSTSRSAR